MASINVAVVDPTGTITSMSMHALIDKFGKDVEPMDRRDARRVKKLRDSRANCPAEHLQPKACTEGRRADVPQCPRCKVIDIRCLENPENKRSRLVVTKTFVSSGSETVLCGVYTRTGKCLPLQVL